MPKVEYDPDMDYEIQQIARHEASVKCASCGDMVPEDGFTFVCDDTWCEQCIIDADLIGYKYG